MAWSKSKKEGFRAGIGFMGAKKKKVKPLKKPAKVKGSKAAAKKSRPKKKARKLTEEQRYVSLSVIKSDIKNGKIHAPSYMRGDSLDDVAREIQYYRVKNSGFEPIA